VLVGEIMNRKQLLRLGIRSGPAMNLAMAACRTAASHGLSRSQIRSMVQAVIQSPGFYTHDPIWSELSAVLAEAETASPQSSEQGVPWKRWGSELDADSIKQMEQACRLPISVRGALMPDAHLGYGLPIGGVLATDGAVIPYAVGVDIACRVKMSVLDVPVSFLEERQALLRRAIEKETRFGIGASFQTRRQHSVMDEDWQVTSITRSEKSKAWSQLGTSGSGNHFVEFGELTVDRPGLGLEPGRYLALLSHSGSRGIGNKVASYYSRLASEKHPELPRELRHLAWLALDSAEGAEYWEAMQLMGRYASANHDLIHRYVSRNLGAEVIWALENHHNFAWKEEHDGRELIVHRKGATPAGKGVMGIIPGSMATPTHIVRGLGNEESLRSAAHGAGRLMSRTAARKRFRWSDVAPVLERRGVEVISAGLDEVPMVYKDIAGVMRDQKDLVESMALFMPRLVKMAPAGERPED
jgi:tRNA-splicing ligase RtcB